MIEISGQVQKVESFIERMRPYEIIELVRTGRIAMIRSRNQTEESENLKNSSASPSDAVTAS